jgi:hypothetical protein
VALVENDQVVQAFSAECPDHSLDDRVRTRRSNGCSDGIDTDPSGVPAEVAAVDGIAIAQQMTRLATLGRRFDDLAPDPGGGRVGGHIHMHQLAPTVGNEHQHV